MPQKIPSLAIMTKKCGIKPSRLMPQTINIFSDYSDYSEYSEYSDQSDVALTD